MNVKGIVFAGTATSEADATTRFFQGIFGMDPQPLEGYPAHVFSFADGSTFGVVSVPSESATRTIGFLVDDIESAAAELRAAGVDVDEVNTNALGRYVHFTAPDGRLYELVEKP